MGKKDKKNSKKGSKSDDDEWYHGVLSTAEASSRHRCHGYPTTPWHKPV